MPSTSTFRIPKAEVTGLYGAIMKMFAKKMLGGEFPDNGYVYFHHKPVLKAVVSFEGKVDKWDRLDENLKSYAQLASAGVIGCSWCLDFGYFKAHNDGLDLDKVREVPRWRESDVFTPLERDVLEYAEAMSVTPLTVTDEMVAHLLDAARRAGRRRADPDDRAREHAVAVQLRRRAAEPGLLRRVRAAPRRSRRRLEHGEHVSLRTRRTPSSPTATCSSRSPTRCSAPPPTPRTSLQETWLRWADVDLDEVRDPRAYLVRITTRLSLNRIRTLSRRRESYVGPWLPEPLLTSPDVAEDVELADSVSTAMLLVLETLTPTERAVFVLREVFDLALRRDRRGRRQDPGRRTPDRAPGPQPRRGPPPARGRRPRRAGRGDRAVHGRRRDRRPPGADGRARPRRRAHHRRRRREAGRPAPDPRARQGAALPGRGARPAPGVPAVEPTTVNGAAGLRLLLDDELDTIATMRIDGGKVTGLYFVRNPHKLARVDEEVPLTR